MSIDRSLKSSGGLKGKRSVLTRAERIMKMSEEGKFDAESDSPFGLPKMRTIRAKVGGKKKKEATEEEETTEEENSES
ncbi:MAG: small basic protein [Phycisphaerae bacterium]|nr:small basic protein [Phycisphaerae bacterium]